MLCTARVDWLEYISKIKKRQEWGWSISFYFSVQLLIIQTKKHCIFLGGVADALGTVGGGLRGPGCFDLRP